MSSTPEQINKAKNYIDQTKGAIERLEKLRLMECMVCLFSK